MRGLLISAVLTAVLIVTGAGTALAHSGLDTGTPGPGDEVTAGVDSVELVFGSLSPSVLPSVEVTGPQGEDHVTGEVTVVDNRVTAPVEPLEAGVYKVDYTIGSADGHRATSAYYFEVLPDPDAEAAKRTTTFVAIGVGGGVVGLVAAFLLRRRLRK
ncbi:copper resistance CopC family protein [Parasphingorhabdus pacifica]